MESRGLTVEEMISTLNHSRIPTLIVEGEDDLQLYRFIEEEITDLNIDVFPCNGRNNLLELYRRKNELNNANLLFLADRDLWVFESIPEQYEGIIFTDGYSIENDIYSASLDKIESLIEEEKRFSYIKAVREYTKWYCYEVKNYLAGDSYKLDINVKQILDHKTKELSPHFLTSRGYKEVDDDFVEDVKDNYYLKLRGKSLLQLWEWFVEPKKIKKNILFEIIFIFQKNNEFTLKIIQKIREHFVKENISKDFIPHQ